MRYRCDKCSKLASTEELRRNCLDVINMSSEQYRTDLLNELNKSLQSTHPNISCKCGGLFVDKDVLFLEQQKEKNPVVTSERTIKGPLGSYVGVKKNG